MKKELDELHHLTYEYVKAKESPGLPTPKLRNELDETLRELRPLRASGATF